MDAADTPAPGDYLLDAGMGSSKQSVAATAFKSGTKRFKQKADDSPGPLTLPSTLKHGRPKMYPIASRHNGIDLLENAPTHNPPSIPAKNQMTGYETDVRTGKLVLQDPVEPGFEGTRYNSVGPGDYEPKIDLKFTRRGVPSFKGSDRAQLDRYESKVANAAPGPGYYNTRSSFEILNEKEVAGSTDFVLHLHASRKKLSASFASGSDRNSMLRDALKPRIGMPGPGMYQLPSAMSDAEKSKPEHLQCFSSSGERFFEPSYKQSITAPGMYTVPTEFEAARIKILKKKKLVSRSGWAYNVAFDGTEDRFKPRRTMKDDIPPPGTYVPTNYDVSANIAKANVRAGAFGSTSKRLGGDDGAEERRKRGVLTREQQLAMELEQDMNDRQHNEAVMSQTSLSSSSLHRQKQRLHKSAFGVGLSEERFSRNLAEENAGPPPGAYDTTPSWSAPGAVPMRETNVRSRKQPETLPGPGDYVLPSSLQYGKPNRKQVMVSTGQRTNFVRRDALEGPGPGTYKTIKSLIRPSHNILLAGSNL